jgi:hypothetical protein
LDGTALVANPDAIIVARKCGLEPRYWWILADIASQFEELSSFVEPFTLVPERVAHRLGALSTEPQEDPVG